MCILLLNESVFLIKSFESMIQWPFHKDDLLSKRIKRFECVNGSLIKTGTCSQLLATLVSYLFIHDSLKPTISKTHSAKYDNP